MSQGNDKRDAKMQRVRRRLGRLVNDGLYRIPGGADTYFAVLEDEKMVRLTAVLLDAVAEVIVEETSA